MVLNSLNGEVADWSSMSPNLARCLLAEGFLRRVYFKRLLVLCCAKLQKSDAFFLFHYSLSLQERAGHLVFGVWFGLPLEFPPVDRRVLFSNQNQKCDCWFSISLICSSPNNEQSWVLLPGRGFVRWLYWWSALSCFQFNFPLGISELSFAFQQLKTCIKVDHVFAGVLLFLTKK